MARAAIPQQTEGIGSQTLLSVPQGLTDGGQAKQGETESELVTMFSHQPLNRTQKGMPPCARISWHWTRAVKDNSRGSTEFGALQGSRRE